MYKYCEGKLKKNQNSGVKQILNFIFNYTFDNYNELQSTFCIMDPQVNIISKFKKNIGSLSKL